MPTDQLESRLKRAERRVTLLGVAFVIAIAGIAYLLQGAPESLRTTSLELVDAQGNTIALLGRKEGRTGLFLMDEKSTARVSIFHADDADGIYVDDNDGVTRIGIAQFAHGGGGVALHGPESRGAAVLYYKNTGSLRFFDADGKVIQEISETRSK